MHNVGCHQEQSASQESPVILTCYKFSSTTPEITPTGETTVRFNFGTRTIINISCYEKKRKLYLEFAKSTTANHTVQHQSSVTKKQGRKTQIHPCTFLQFSFESTMLDVHFITKQQKSE